MKDNFRKLPDFVGGAIDFGALASATNLSKMLAQDSCPHAKDVKETDLEGPADLGVTSRDIRRSVRHFMKSFWVKFGRAEVVFFFVVYSFSLKLFDACLLFLQLCIVFAGVADDGGCACYC